MFHKESNEIPIKKGVWQGYTVSPMLFTACLQDVFRDPEWEELRIRANEEDLNSLRFADVMALLSNAGDELQLFITDLDKESRKIGPKIILQKTK